jgi:hypothetical protein
LLTRAPRNRSIRASIALIVLCLPACYRVTSPGPAQPAVANPPHTMTTLIWGLLQDDSLDAICQGRGGIAEVTAATPPLYALATVVTLGFWAPIVVETKCAATGDGDARK